MRVSAPDRVLPSKPTYSASRSASAHKARRSRTAAWTARLMSSIVGAQSRRGRKYTTLSIAPPAPVLIPSRISGVNVGTNLGGPSLGPGAWRFGLYGVGEHSAD